MVVWWSPKSGKDQWLVQGRTNVPIEYQKGTDCKYGKCKKYGKTQTFKLTHTPKVAHNAAMSSSVVGRASNPVWLRQVVKNNILYKIASPLTDGMSSQLTADIRGADGVFADYSGINTGIAAAQKRGPKRVLKFLVLDHSPPKKLVSETTNFWVDVREWCVAKGCTRIQKSKVFAGPEKILKPIGIGQAVYLRSTETTVRNEDFDVDPGWTVDLIVVTDNFDISMAMTKHDGTAKAEALATQSEAILDKLKKLHPDFFK